MIGYLKGKIVLRRAGFVIIETGGVGYKVFVGDDFPSSGAVEAYTFHNVREDASDLYGFSSPELLGVFELLVSVNGVGPKVAINLVSRLGAQAIFAAIANNDPSIFKSVPGVGTKVAAKIVVELKNKVAGGASSDILPQEDETVEALLALGYKKNEIYPIIQTIPPDIIDVRQKVRYVLKNVGKK